MKRHQGRVSADAVAHFLLLEPLFPRSVRFSLRAADVRLARIRPPEEENLPGEACQLRLVRLVAWVESREHDFDPAKLHPVLTTVVDETSGIAEDIGREFLGQPGRVAAQSQAQ